jgi:hypothetical protein
MTIIILFNAAAEALNTGFLEKTLKNSPLLISLKLFPPDWFSITVILKNHYTELILKRD